MKKLAGLLKKLNSPITYGVATCAAGLAFIILPEALLDTVILILGAAIALVATCLIAVWAFDPRSEELSLLARHGAIIKSSLLLLFGSGLMLVRSSVSRPVCIILGILLALYSIFRLSRPGRSIVERSVGWYAEGIALVLFIFLGAVVVILPFWPKVTAGVAMVAFGGKLLFDSIVKGVKNRKDTHPRVKKSPKKRADIYTTDFIDKSDN